MFETRIAKLFKNGASQAVRLPAEFRFDADQVYVTKDTATGDLIISQHPGAAAWSRFFEMARSIEQTDEFMHTRPMNSMPQEKGLFDEDA